MSVDTRQIDAAQLSVQQQITFTQKYTINQLTMSIKNRITVGHGNLLIVRYSQAVSATLLVLIFACCSGPFCLKSHKDFADIYDNFCVRLVSLLSLSNMKSE